MGVLKILLACCIFVVFLLHEKHYVHGKELSELNENSSPDDIIEATLTALKDNDEATYKKLEKSPGKKNELIKAMKEVAKTQKDVEDSLADDLEPDDVEEVLMKSLSSGRVKMLKDGLKIPTFKLTLTKQQDGMFSAAYTSDVMTFKGGPQILQSKSDVTYTKVKQWASITVEAIMLVASAAGVSVGSAKTTAKVIDKAEASIKALPKFQRALKAFEKAWEKAGKSKFTKAKAVFNLVKDSYSAGIFWNIIKSIFSEMSWWDWAKTSAKITLIVVAAFATGGAALIAEIALAITAAVEFAQKLINMKTLNSIRYLK